MVTDRRSWLSPALLIQSAVLIVGGLTVYYSTISEIRVALAENRLTTHHHETTIDELRRELLDIDRKLNDHDEAVRKNMPLGRKSEMDQFKPERGMN